ncbi:MAG: ATP-binding domain-containing protein [Candidatus Lokiarchaeota archaeon]|nr:ATP-binding domain-containing protein [Candidatus Lokiarchaeota archaeon]
MLNKPPPNATQGENLVFNRLDFFTNSHPEALGYVEPDIGGFRPDFLLLSPKFGVIIIEVKDYLPENLLFLNKSGGWEILQEDKKIFVKNPFDQVYNYWRSVQDRVSHCKFSNNLEVPIVRIVVFSNISKKEAIAESIKNLAPLKIHICFKETLLRNDSFESYLADVLPAKCMLSKQQFEILRANIIPSCRLPTTNQARLSMFYSEMDKIILLDQEQERLARKLGDGHRLICGVAGSGKTVLLIARARILALRHPDWKILILCYNKNLKKQLFRLLNPQDYNSDITISTFHGWARQYIQSTNSEYSRLYEEANQKAEREHKIDDFFDIVVPKILMETIQSLGENRTKYNAILIDEAQDFKKEWLQTVVSVLNEETNSLLIACDGIQGIYARKPFHWSDAGIQARGRTKRFENSYRTPIEVGELAQKALPDFIAKLLGKFDEFIPTKRFLGIRGTVKIEIFNSREEECQALAEHVCRISKESREILILFKKNLEKNGFNHPVFRYLKDLGVKWNFMGGKDMVPTAIQIGTIYGTKGLESNTIIVPEVDTYVSDKDRQLLYVAMTRSKSRLILTAKKSTGIVNTLRSFQKLRQNPTNGIDAGAN